ncbi:serine hydrolase domain-containing protein [Glycomyces sp. YM15]|uniref:serine hydrolase domain-containing protein n=1 Tax=Glycomyces sp. YM15 TaxID=2800446 RepID=UPI00196698B2|nr:serine hydrolase domain-containing protein [Glycomyces sp. YM15]
MRRPIHGHADEDFGPLADAFAANFADHGDTGAACAVYRNGHQVVDLWGGTAGADRPWQSDTPAPVFSVTKALIAISAYVLQERGLLDLDALVADYWPEFAQRGKKAVTIRQALSHRAGLPHLDEDLTVPDVAAWHPVIGAIERQAPLWEPGSAYRYHPLTFGWLIGEPIRRVTGMTPGRFIAAEIAGPLRAEAWLGVPAEHRARIAPLQTALSTTPDRAISLGHVFPDGLFAARGGVNDLVTKPIEVPGGGAAATASALARILAATVGEVDGVRLLGDDSVRDALIVRSEGRDWEGNPANRFSTGFMINGTPWRPLLSDASFGHDGACGQLAFADADANLGFGYVNGTWLAEDVRAERLVLALRKCLG